MAMLTVPEVAERLGTLRAFRPPVDRRAPHPLHEARQARPHC
jgi:hypothetical protein